MDDPDYNESEVGESDGGSGYNSNKSTYDSENDESGDDGYDNGDVKANMKGQEVKVMTSSPQQHFVRTLEGKASRWNPFEPEE